MFLMCHSWLIRQELWYVYIFDVSQLTDQTGTLGCHVFDVSQLTDQTGTLGCHVFDVLTYHLACKFHPSVFKICGMSWRLCGPYIVWLSDWEGGGGFFTVHFSWLLVHMHKAYTNTLMVNKGNLQITVIVPKGRRLGRCKHINIKHQCSHQLVIQGNHICHQQRSGPHDTWLSRVTMTTINKGKGHMTPG